MRMRVFSVRMKVELPELLLARTQIWTMTGLHFLDTASSRSRLESRPCATASSRSRLGSDQIRLGTEPRLATEPRP